LKGVPVATITPPSGVVTAKINPETGLREVAGTMTEYFLQEQLPAEAEDDKVDDVLRSAEDVIKEFFSQ
jgi:penicillin-binding protein 1A